MSEKPVRKVWINGISGQMGRAVCQVVDGSATHVLAGGTNSDGNYKRHDEGEFYKVNLEDVDFNVVVDFSTPEGNAQLFDKLTDKEWRKGVVVIATTNISEGQLANWKKLGNASGLRVIFAPNASIGANMFMMHVREVGHLAAGQFPDVEITEKHHREKVDSPSGPAKRIAELIKKARPEELDIIYGRNGKRTPDQLAIHSLRGGTVIGEHSVSFIGDHEEIIMTHRAESRNIFAQGSLVLAEWLLSLKKGGLYSLDDVFCWNRS